MNASVLGENSRYPRTYSPEILQALPRSSSRSHIGVGDALPFRGQDLWNAWELTWQDERGKPVVGTATITVDAGSPSLVESKSLKLYLNAFAMCRFASTDELQNTVAADLSSVTESAVLVDILPSSQSTSDTIGQLPGTCLDGIIFMPTADGVSAELLQCECQYVTFEELHSHLLRSNCPVTDQPDTGSILIRYSGKKIVAESLLAYVVSYRNHNDFHEACVERIFVDIKARCAPERLTVYARYNRRGGIDINPFRSDFEESADNLRLWRQ